mmetsp:Transcript_56315/g.128033  ORF Transcript_56315/g.128033 Transcript_56315/m.128033 type:complete len:216 (-) Transcript_56315:85-732(-)
MWASNLEFSKSLAVMSQVTTSTGDARNAAFRTAMPMSPKDPINCSKKNRPGNATLIGTLVSVSLFTVCLVTCVQGPVAFLEDSTPTMRGLNLVPHRERSTVCKYCGRSRSITTLPLRWWDPVCHPSTCTPPRSSSSMSLRADCRVSGGSALAIATFSTGAGRRISLSACQSRWKLIFSHLWARSVFNNGLSYMFFSSIAVISTLASGVMSASTKV